MPELVQFSSCQTKVADLAVAMRKQYENLIVIIFI